MTRCHKTRAIGFGCGAPIAACAEPVGDKSARTGDLQRRPEAVLLCCGYNIRPIFEGAETAPTKRDTPFAIGVPDDGGHPRVCEIPPLILEALGMLVDWTDQSELGATPQVDELARYELVEVHP